MESLWDYYYLTGDRRALERGVQAARTFATSPNWANDFDLGIGEPGITTRSIGQKLNTMLEGYLASGDAQLQAAVQADAQDFVTTNGKPEHFFSSSRSATGTYFADQAFMGASIYLPPLWKVHALTGNTDVRDKLIFTPRRIFENYRCLGQPCPGAGGVCGPDVFVFYNTVMVTATGGGSFTVAPACGTGSTDDHLYDSATMGVVTAMCRSAALSGDTALALQARELFEERALPAFFGTVWDKGASQYSLRAAEALACIEGLSAAPTPLPSGRGLWFQAALAFTLLAAGLFQARRRRSAP
jgi:hypothetical protein